MQNSTFSRFYAVTVHWTRRLSAVAGLLLAQFILVTGVHAQNIAPRPTIARVTDVFEGRPERVLAGSRIALKTKNLAAARRVVHSGLQVRIFSLRDDQSSPSPITTIDDCDVFLAVVLAIEAPNDTEAIVPTLGDGWLNMSDSLNSILPGKYFLVFEQLGPTSEQFRLKKSDYAAYFDSGFQLTVDQRDGTSVEAVRSAYFQRRDKLGRLRLEIDDRQRAVPCYTYRRLVAQAEPTSDLQISQSQLDFCELGAQTEPAM